MRYNDLTEYNKSLIYRSRLEESGEAIGILPNPIGGTLNVYYFEEENVCYYFATDKDKNIIGHLTLQHVIDDIWQVIDAHTTIQGKGVGTNLYHFVARSGNKSELPGPGSSLQAN